MYIKIKGHIRDTDKFTEQCYLDLFKKKNEIHFKELTGRNWKPTKEEKKEDTANLKEENKK